ncbi:hypothetical protein [Baekduia sp. Peel2402]
MMLSGAMRGFENASGCIASMCAQSGSATGRLSATTIIGHTRFID